MNEKREREKKSEDTNKMKDCAGWGRGGGRLKGGWNERRGEGGEGGGGGLGRR